jgi:hypothetical protein
LCPVSRYAGRAKPVAGKPREEAVVYLNFGKR